MRTNNLTIGSLCLFFLIMGICLSLIRCEKKLHGDKYSQVEGFVKDSLNEIAIVGADVFLDGDSLIPYAKTDSTGYYRVGLLGGPMVAKVTVKMYGYKTQAKSTMLKPDQIQRLDFLLVKE